MTGRRCSFAIIPLVLAISIAAPSRAQQAEAYAEPNQPIVVTGIRIEEYRDRLTACLARGCPPNEDIDATLALAEAYFLQGEYRDGRAAVRHSLRRNRTQAGAYPEAVSDLYRAATRFARHLGFDTEGMRSAYGALEALQQGIPQEDHRHFTARLELAEVLMQRGRLPSAQRQLDELVRQARAAGREDVVTIARLRSLWYDYLKEPVGQSRRELAEMSRLTDPARRMEAIGARILLSQILRLEGDAAEADALLAELARGPSSRRRLVHAPPFQLLGRSADAAEEDLDIALRPTSGINRQSIVADGRQWVDIGFWVLPDGRVEDPQILRSASSTRWARPLLDSIRRRFYSAAEEATYRLERYTLTAELITRGTSRGRGPPRVEYLDLTIAESPQPARSGVRPN